MIRYVKSHKGLTLLEVMFSLGILATTLLALMITFPKMKMLVNKSQCKVAAIKACQTKMEELREISFVNLPSEGTDTDNSIVLDNGADLDSFDDDIPCSITTTIIDVEDSGVTIAKKIMIQCTWIENNAECSEYLDCVLYNNIIE
ncbi:MAG: type II secretion system protein [Candidatus Omnitrophica bacterium]|nr:type II secretion system protein [Candidatus Omnitrophota bacterium]